MRQQTLTEGSFKKYRKATRRERFLVKMNGVMQWSDLCALFEPVYPQRCGAGRPAMGLERMLRIHYL